MSKLYKCVLVVFTLALVGCGDDGTVKDEGVSSRTKQSPIHVDAFQIDTEYGKITCVWAEHNDFSEAGLSCDWPEQERGQR